MHSTARINAYTGLNKSRVVQTRFYVNKALPVQINANHENNAVPSFNSRIENPHYRNKVDEDEQKNQSARAANCSTGCWVYGSIGLYIVVVILFFRLLQQNQNRK